MIGVHRTATAWTGLPASLSGDGCHDTCSTVGRVNFTHKVWLSVHASCGVTNPQKINVSGMYLVAGVNPAGQYDPNR